MDQTAYSESQKTVYVINNTKDGRSRKRLKTETTTIDIPKAVAGEGLVVNDSNIPFLQLLNGDEPLEHVNLRYKLYSESIKRQETASLRIMNDLNEQILTDITSLVKRSNEEDYIDAVAVIPNSSVSTSSAFISQLDEHLSKNPRFRTVILNSKEANTTRQVLKTIVDGVTKDTGSSTTSGRQKVVINDNDEVGMYKDGYENTDDFFDRRLPYDLDIVEEWCQRNKNDFSDDIRVVLIFEDVDSFNLSLLNRLLKLLHSFIGRIPFKLVLSIGTDLKSFTKKLDIDTAHYLTLHSFRIEQTDLIINKVVNEIILEEHYLIGEEVTKFILDRFILSIKNVDEFLKIVKFSKMVFFFGNPLSIILDSFVKNSKDLSFISAPYIKALRKLPSFKRHVTSLVERNTEIPTIKSLLDDDESVLELLKSSFRAYITSLKVFKTVYKFITDLLVPKAFKHHQNRNYLEFFYKLSSRDEFVKMQFINELIKNLQQNITIEQITTLTNEITQLGEHDDIIQSLNSKMKLNLDFNTLVEYVNEPLQYKIESRKLKDNFISTLDEFLKKNLKFDDDMRVVTFNEIFQLNDIDIVEPNLVPRYRSVIEDSLINHEAYLADVSTGNKAFDKLNELLDPIITSLYQIYRETTLHLNIYDFYTSFRYSLDQKEIMKTLNEILDDSDKILENYLNDDERFKYLYRFFNDVDVSEEAKWEKFILALFLQKCEEMIGLGFFKFLTKKKADTLEKSFWKDL